MAMASARPYANCLHLAPDRHTKANLNLTVDMLVKVCTSFFTTVVNNTALNSSDNLPDNHHMSDAREEIQLTEPSPIQQAAYDSVFHQM